MELSTLSDRLRLILNELEKVTDAMEALERQKSTACNQDFLTR